MLVGLDDCVKHSLPTSANKVHHLLYKYKIVECYYINADIHQSKEPRDAQRFCIA